MAATAAQPPARRGGGLWSSSPVRLLLVVDAVLVTVLLVLAVTTAGSGGASRGAPGASGSTSATGTATTASSPGAVAPSPTTPTPASTAGPGRFASPSGNIECDMSRSGVTCTIASITFTPPAAAGCTGALGHVVALDSSGVHLPCPEGPAPTVAGADVPELVYGSSSTVGAFTCTSATNGVTCTDESGVGFRLARSAFTELG